VAHNNKNTGETHNPIWIQFHNSTNILPSMSYALPKSHSTLPLPHANSQLVAHITQSKMGKNSTQFHLPCFKCLCPAAVFFTPSVADFSRSYTSLPHEPPHFFLQVTHPHLHFPSVFHNPRHSAGPARRPLLPLALSQLTAFACPRLAFALSQIPLLTFLLLPTTGN